MLLLDRKELLAATLLAALLLEVAAIPSPYDGFPLDDIRRPVYRGNMRTRDLKSATEVIVKSVIPVGGAEDGRAVSGTPYPPTTPQSMTESVKSVTKQLLQAPSATDMVAADVRTPPKVKSQVKPQEVADTDFVPLGTGHAEPVPMEDTSAYEIITAPPAVKQSTQATGGLSTWILLSNAEQSTIATNKKKQSVPPTAEPKKTFKPTMATSIIEKVKKPEDPKNSKPTHKPVALPLKKENSTKNETSKGTPVVLQDPKFKNKTPVVVGKVPTSQDKVETATKKTVTLATTPLPTMTRKRPISFGPTPPTRHVYDLVPTTSLLVETDHIGTLENSAGESSTKSSTRRPTTNKKRKKNKNKRKRPSKPESETAESKVEETSLAPNTKVDSNNRPMSTRIYNYLAREVMPTVGVGLVGLVLTAGLAGLFLYPFGGGIARRNYEKGPGPSNHQMHYYNSYAPHPSHDQNGDGIFSQAFSNHNGFSPSYDPGKYSMKNKYQYDSDDYNPKEVDYNVNGYAGNSDYSTLPDSVKNGDYPKMDYTNSKMDYANSKMDYTNSKMDYTNSKMSDYQVKPDYDAKITDYSTNTPGHPMKNHDFSKTIDYSMKPDYSISDKIKTTDYALPEVSKYYSMDPMSMHYKLTDSSSQAGEFKEDEHRFPSLTEYSSYANPTAIGTSDSYTTKEQQNDTLTMAEDKSDKSQPHFSALVGSPQFSNADFVGSVSLSSGYGTHDNVVRHRTGILAVDHGPRNMQLPNDDEKRVKRDIHDDFSNEIDGGESIQKKPSSEMPTSQQTEITTSKYFDGTTTFGSHTTVADETSTNNYDSKIPQENPISSNGSEELDQYPPTNSSDLTNVNGGFLDFISRLAQMKLKIGISLLRTTSEAFTRYLTVVTKRMEEAVRTMENRKHVTEQKRQRRDLFKQLKKSKIIKKTSSKHSKIQ